MALGTFRASIKQPAAASLAETMNDIRSWLDSHKIQPVEFKSHSSNDGAVAFELAFRSEEEVHLFERDFRIRGGIDHIGA